MTKLSSESTSLLETARREYLPSEDARRRIRERILDGARAPKTPESIHGSVAADGSRSGLSSMKTLGLASACAFVLVSFFAVRVATVENRTAGTNDDHAIVTPAPPSDGRGGEAKRELGPASNEAPASEATISPYLLPDAPPPPSAKPSASAIARKPLADSPAPVAAATAEPAANVATDSLGSEMRILREAHAASKSGDSARAMTFLDEHARTYPRGVLREERLALTALVLCAQGRQADARRAAEELAHANPRSSHLERLRGSCVADATFPSAPSRD